MTITVNESCLVTSAEDIVVDGVRYGIAWWIDDYDIWLRRPRKMWLARFDTPDLMEVVTPRWFMEPGACASENRDEAIFMAFEDFVRANNLTEDEYARIGLELFGDAVTDVLREAMPYAVNA